MHAKPMTSMDYMEALIYCLSTGKEALYGYRSVISCSSVWFHEFYEITAADSLPISVPGTTTTQENIHSKFVDYLPVTVTLGVLALFISIFHNSSISHNYELKNFFRLKVRRSWKCI